MADWNREREIFEKCLQRQPAGRPAYLAEACGEDTHLRRRMLRLLRAHERAEKDLPDRISLVRDFLTPKQLGSYRIVRILGEGGMGTVYLAEQIEPFKRRVALKVVKPGMTTSDVVSRFEGERQALAVMDHPGIAKVFDAGLTPEGRPFFVMEWVDGVPLLDYCDRNRLTVKERLELFISLCRAVQHAHQKGVIHRDLKPSNVLVTVRDGKPLPKIIDFGIAKAVGEQRLTERGLITEHGQAPIGTPAYMSPEQAGSQRLDIDTRSDIYSLGVILYEILVGALPIDPRQVGLPQFVVQLGQWETDPAAPSFRLGQLADRRQRITRQRSTNLDSLRRELKGDLDWIVMKAMDKDRERRYQTAYGLSLDLARHLADEPISARPPSLPYRLSKFVRRNRVAVIAAMVTLVAVLAGVVGTTQSLIRARRAEHEARQEAARAVQEEQKALERLRAALLAEVRSRRHSHSPGRRHVSLDLLAQAAAIQPGRDIIREAIAAMALTDVRTEKEWPRPQDHVRIVFTPTLDRYAVGFKGGRIEVREVPGQPLLTIPGFGGNPWIMRFSPDGRLLAVRYGGTGDGDRSGLRVWDMSSGRCIYSRSDEVAYTDVDFDPSGELLAWGTADSRLVVHNLRTGREQLRVRLDAVASTLRFHPEGRRLAVRFQSLGRIDILELSQGHTVQRLHYPSVAMALEWSPHGHRLAAGYADFLAVIWDVEMGRRLATLTGHQAEVVHLNFHPSGDLIATSSWDQTSRLWNARSGQELLSHTGGLYEFSRDGTRIPYYTGQSVGIFRLLHGEVFRTLHGHEGKNPASIDISGDGRWIISGGDDGIILWEAATGRRLAADSGVSAGSVFFHPRRREFYSCGHEGLLSWKLKPVAEGIRLVRGSRLSDGPCHRAAIDPHGGAIAYSFNNVVYLRRLNAHHQTTVLGPFEGTDRLTLSAGARWVASGNWRGHGIRVWNGQTGAVETTLLPEETPLSAVFSRDGEWLAAGTPESFRVWRTSNWGKSRRIRRPLGFSGVPGLAAFSGDGTLLAVSATHSTVQLLRTARLEPIASFEAPDPRNLTKILFGPDHSTLVTASRSHQIQIWNLAAISSQLLKLGLSPTLLHDAGPPPGDGSG